MGYHVLTDDEIYVAVGEKVRAARLARNLTQEQVADRIGLERSSVANIERGTQRLPIHVLYRIAAALDFPFIDLLPPSPTKSDVIKSVSVDISKGLRNVVVPEGVASILANLNLSMDSK